MNTLLTQGALFFNGSKNALIYGSLVLSTLVLEEIFEKVVFHCPCEGHFTYGLLFLIGPVAVLFAAGILLNTKTRLFFSLCRIQQHCREFDGLERNKRRCCRHALVMFIEITCTAMISPSIWLILSFLQKTFFICAVFGPGTEKLNTAGGTTQALCATAKPRGLYREADLIAMSQRIGLALSIIGTVIVLLGAFVSHCTGHNSKLRLPDEKFYMRLEAKEAAKEFHRRAKQVALEQGQREVEQVFQEIQENHYDSYLTLVSTASKRLDQKYSRYFDSSLFQASERKGREPSNDEPSAHTQTTEQVIHYRIDEDYTINSYLVVDGKNMSSDSECEIEADCTITTSRDNDTYGALAQSNFTRVCLKRSTSVK